MTTAREIRTLTVTTLKAAATIAGARVFDSRSKGRPLTPDELPALVVKTNRGRHEESRHGNEPHFRVIERLLVECHAQTPATFGVDAEDRDAEAARLRDVLEDQVLTALFTDFAWIDLFEFVKRTEMERGWDVESAGRIAVSVITIDCQFDRSFQPVIADDLDTIAIDVDMIDPTDDGTPGPDGKIDVVLEVDLT